MKNIDPQILQVSRIHEFQQVTLPGWVFDPDCYTIVDLYCGFLDMFMTSIRKECGEKFADSITVKPLADPEGHLLEFGPPEEATLCRFIFISVAPYVRIFLAEHSVRGGLMFCERNEDGAHCNHGPFKGKTAKAFMEKIREVLSAEN
ncbi:MAG: hypothetical protein ACOYM3_02230 [Terrimicrobiaceae bacterium]